MRFACQGDVYLLCKRPSPSLDILSKSKSFHLNTYMQLTYVDVFPAMFFSGCSSRKKKVNTSTLK